MLWVCVFLDNAWTHHTHFGIGLLQMRRSDSSELLLCESTRTSVRLTLLFYKLLLIKWPRTQHIWSYLRQMTRSRFRRINRRILRSCGDKRVWHFQCQTFQLQPRWVWYISTYKWCRTQRRAPGTTSTVHNRYSGRVSGVVEWGIWTTVLDQTSESNPWQRKFCRIFVVPNNCVTQSRCFSLHQEALTLWPRPKPATSGRKKIFNRRFVAAVFSFVTANIWNPERSQLHSNTNLTLWPQVRLSQWNQTMTPRQCRCWVRLPVYVTLNTTPPHEAAADPGAGRTRLSLSFKEPSPERLVSRF